MSIQDFCKADGVIYELEEFDCDADTFAEESSTVASRPVRFRAEGIFVNRTSGQKRWLSITAYGSTFDVALMEFNSEVAKFEREAEA